AVLHHEGPPPGAGAGRRVPDPVRPPRRGPAGPRRPAGNGDRGPGGDPALRPPPGRRPRRPRHRQRTRRVTPMPLELDERLRHTPRPARTPAPLGELQSSGDIRILILDDDPATCSVIQAALSNRDFQIDAVSDPMLVESVLSRRGHYHLIIMDYVMPGLEADQVFGW